MSGLLLSSGLEVFQKGRPGAFLTEAGHSQKMPSADSSLHRTPTRAIQMSVILSGKDNIQLHEFETHLPK